MSRDMTRGPIARTMLAFLVPLILSGFLQQLYSWVDALIVGNFVGENPLAAIGATGSISNLFINTLMGFSVGVSIFAAQSYGEGKSERIAGIARTFLVFLGGLSILIAAAAFLFVKPLLRLLKTPSDILDLSVSYLSIILIGIPVLAVYNIYTAVLRGIGDSRMPLYAIAVSACVNLALDLLFVAGFGWGVVGAAVATVISQAAMTAFIILYGGKRYQDLRFKKGDAWIHSEMLRRGLRLGLPSAIQYGIRSLCSLPLQSVMNSFGTPTVAAITTAYRIDSLIFLPIINLDSGVSTFVAQNIGAGDKKRADKGLRVGIIIGIILSAAIAAIIVPAGASILRLFGITEEAVAIGRQFFFDIAMFYPLFAVLNVYTGYLRGSGDVKYVGIAGIAASVVRVLLSFLLAQLMGNRVIAWAEVFSWVFLFILYAYRFLRHRRRERANRPA